MDRERRVLTNARQRDVGRGCVWLAAFWVGSMIILLLFWAAVYQLVRAVGSALFAVVT